MSSLDFLGCFLFYIKLVDPQLFLLSLDHSGLLIFKILLKDILKASFKKILT